MAKIGVHPRGLPGLPADHAAIPVWNAENWFFEDFEIGDKIRSIRRTISEGESMAFNSLVMDHHPYVSDERFAVEEGVFGRRLVAGAFVFSLGLGLAATNCLNSFSYGYDRLRFIKPVFIGDTIYTPAREPFKTCAQPDHGQAEGQLFGLQGRGRTGTLCRTSADRAVSGPRPFCRTGQGRHGRKGGPP